jgi:hypothetical protein
VFEKYQIHNQFTESLKVFLSTDPHLLTLSRLTYQYSFNWWEKINFEEPGIYILTGGRQVGKSTSCKLLIKECLRKKRFKKSQLFYLPCDEIFDAQQLSQIIRSYLNTTGSEPFLLIIDEVTYVKDWDRVIKALADEGHFQKGLCLLTGSDSVILKEAAMRFPGRRGIADVTDFHLFPLSFNEYANLVSQKKSKSLENLEKLFRDYLVCGGYLRAINDLASHGKIMDATYLTYEQWIRGDFNKRGKNEDYLLSILSALLIIGVNPTSYRHLAQKIGLITVDTCLDYCHLLERMDILLTLQAFDQNNKRGFPRKDKKFHFLDPFIYHVIYRWAQREGHLNHLSLENTMVEATVAAHCNRSKKTFYFKGQGEIDLITFQNNLVEAIEVKWANQLRPNDLKMLKQFNNSIILVKKPLQGNIENIHCTPVYQYLYEMGKI